MPLAFMGTCMHTHTCTQFIKITVSDLSSLCSGNTQRLRVKGFPSYPSFFLREVMRQLFR